jgi:hypothetical protein
MLGLGARYLRIDGGGLAMKRAVVEDVVEDWGASTPTRAAVDR